MVNLRRFEQDILRDDVSEDEVDEYPVAKVGKMWAQYGHQYTPCEHATPGLPAGMYTTRANDDGKIWFVQQTVETDTLQTPIHEQACMEVLDTVTQFVDMKDLYAQHGFMWKRGVLMYGPPGSGKTSLLRLIAQRAIEMQNAVIIFATVPHWDAKSIRQMRLIEPDRLIVVVFEDIDAIIEHYGEEEILSILDGEQMVDNILFVATTNYPEKLDERLTHRPSRFDVVTLINNPGYESRLDYLNTKLVDIYETEVIEKMARDTDDLSMADIKELMVSILCYKYEIDATVKRLKDARSAKYNSDEYKRVSSSIGFTSSVKSAK